MFYGKTKMTKQKQKYKLHTEMPRLKEPSNAHNHLVAFTDNADTQA